MELGIPFFFAKLLNIRPVRHGGERPEAKGELSIYQSISAPSLTDFHELQVVTERTRSYTQVAK